LAARLRDVERRDERQSRDAERRDERQALQFQRNRQQCAWGAWGVVRQQTGRARFRGCVG